MVDLAERLSTLENNRTVRSAFALIVIGMGLKVGVYTLHRWLPGAYAYAPTPVSAFLAATSTKVALYVILRFSLSVFSARFGFEVDTLTLIVLPLAIIAMFSASLVAVFQANVERLLAYSSIGQIGYMLLGFSLLNLTGVSATLTHLFAHAFTKGALFLAVGCIIYRIGSPLLPHMAGLGRKMPWTSAAIALGGLSLIGVPGTVGFTSKFLLITSALEKGWWPIALLIVLSSLIAVVYVWRVVETLYLQPAAEGITASEAPLSLLLPTWALILVCIYFGFDGETLVQAARAGAESLLNGGFGNDAVIMNREGR